MDSSRVNDVTCFLVYLFKNRLSCLDFSQIDIPTIKSISLTFPCFHKVVSHVPNIYVFPLLLELIHEICLQLGASKYWMKVLDLL